MGTSKKAFCTSIVVLWDGHMCVEERRYTEEPRGAAQPAACLLCFPWCGSLPEPSAHQGGMAQLRDVSGLRQLLPYLSTLPPVLSSVQWPTNTQSGREEPIKETPVIFHLLMDRQLMMILWWLLSIEWITFWPVLLSHFHCTLNSVCHVRPSILSEPLTQFSRAAALAQLPHFVSGAL